MFHHHAEELTQLCQYTLDLAHQHGATAAEADLSESHGQSVSVRLGEIDQIEYQQDRSLDITIYIGHSKGSAATADFSQSAIQAAVRAAADIARHTAQDECAGLADAHLMARPPEDDPLQSHFEWALSTEQALDIAKECESLALQHDSRIGNSEGAAVQTGHYQTVYGNSHGFLHHRRASRHSLSCSLVAGEGEHMQRDYWYDIARNPARLDSPADIARTAAERTLRRLHPRTVPTGRYPIVFDNTVSASLIGHLIGALSGGALYRGTSFLPDSIGQAILPSAFSLREEPHIPQALASALCDAEGVATAPRYVIENGIIRGYFLNSYSARKLGLQTTANAGGIHNLILNSSHASQAELLRDMGNGLLITELMGQGVNPITGDYSRGAAGFWVENGTIAYPVAEITIASRLQDMLPAICGVANDPLKRSANKIGSILIPNMTVAGA